MAAAVHNRWQPLLLLQYREHRTGDNPGNMFLCQIPNYYKGAVGWRVLTAHSPVPDTMFGVRWRDVNETAKTVNRPSLYNFQQ